MSEDERYLPLEDYGLIGDCHSCALVSRAGSIDWCCLPRFDSGSHFARLLDRDRGGHCAVEIDGEATARRYLDDTLVLETDFETEKGEARLLDFFAWPSDERQPEILRIVEGHRGTVEFGLTVAPRFDYGAVAPWLRGDDGVFAAIGGDDGLLIRTDCELEVEDRHLLTGGGSVGAGERRHLVLSFRRPVALDSLEECEELDPGEVDEALEKTAEAWRDWASRAEQAGDAGAARSALILKALSYEPTGAIVASATTSLPEARDLSGERNWDYRYSWIRDSSLAVRSLAELGYEKVADDFRCFIERSAAGHASDLQIVFGVGGERRIGEEEIDGLEGWNGASPIRVGNDASRQRQLDVLGQIVDQSWRWHKRGNSPDDDYWLFVADVVEAAVERWAEPDRGIWEWRGEPRHFVHSKALTWAAIDRGIRLAEDTDRPVPKGWPEARDEIRAAIESRGYDEDEGVFVAAFDSEDVDAALLRLPAIEFLEWTDERMVRTAAAIAERLDFDGLLRRYEADDGWPEEGAFLPCTFWLATCLAKQHKATEAQEVFDAATACANDLGLFSEEYDPERGRMLGNFPQALTHMSHIEAALALEDYGAARTRT